MTIYQWLEFLWTLRFAREHQKWWGLGLGPFEDKQVGHVQSMRAKGKIAEKQLKLELGKAYCNLSSFGIPLCKISRTALTLGWRNFIWWHPSECPEGLARANWKAEFISLMELRILWLGWSQNCWINWHLTVAKCTLPSGLSHRLCCNKRAFRICVAGCFNCTKGDPSLVAVTLHSHITLQSITSSLSSSTM